MPGCTDAVAELPFLLGGAEGYDVADDFVAWDPGAWGCQLTKTGVFGLPRRTMSSYSLLAQLRPSGRHLSRGL